MTLFDEVDEFHCAGCECATDLTKPILSHEVKAWFVARIKELKKEIEVLKKYCSKLDKQDIKVEWIKMVDHIALKVTKQTIIERKEAVIDFLMKEIPITEDDLK